MAKWRETRLVLEFQEQTSIPQLYEELLKIIIIKKCRPIKYNNETVAKINRTDKTKLTKISTVICSDDGLQLFVNIQQ